MSTEESGNSDWKLGFQWCACVCVCVFVCCVCWEARRGSAPVAVSLSHASMRQALFCTRNERVASLPRLRGSHFTGWRENQAD